MIRVSGIAALFALGLGVFLLAREQPSTSLASPPAQEGFSGSTNPVEAPAPGNLPLGGALLRAVRTGEQAAYDRITFEFEGGLPGYRVEYVAPPIIADPSGQEVGIEGTAFLQIRMEPAAGHDPNTGDATYTGPLELKPGLPSLLEADRTGDFEGVLTWVLGLSGRLPFRVLTLQGPDRLVVDVGHAVVATEPAGLPGTGGTPGTGTPAGALPLVAVAFVPLALFCVYAFMRRRRAP